MTKQKTLPFKQRQLLKQIAFCNDALEHWPDDRDSTIKPRKWVSDCGTYKCYFGDFLCRRLGLSSQEFARKMMETGKINNNNLMWRAVDMYFGMSNDTSDFIFGVGEQDNNHRKIKLKAHRGALMDQLASYVEVGEAS